MITVRDLIQEEWADTVKIYDKAVDVFINPTKKDVQEIGKTARFIAYHPTKTVYVWNSEILHKDMYRALKSNNHIDSMTSSYLFDPNIVAGTGINYGDGRITFFRAFNMEYDKGAETVKQIAKKDWSFAEKYIKGIKDFIVPFKQLKEEWVDTFTVNNFTIEIFKNPTQKEMEEAADSFNKRKYIRFIVGKENPVLYVFSSDMLHDKVINFLYKKGIEKQDFIRGTADKTREDKKFTVDYIQPMKKNHKEFLLKYMDIDISEEWIDTLKDRGEGYEIFKNPDRKDIQELLKNSYGRSLRFIIYFPTKDVFVWNAELFHGYVFMKLIKGKHIKTDVDNYLLNDGVIAGIARAGKSLLPLSFVESYNKHMRERGALGKRIASHDWSFAEKYIRGIKEYTNSFKKTLKEEWSSTHKIHNQSVEVFENPSKKDVEDLYKAYNKEVRFIAYHPTKTVYVWDSSLSLHKEMYEALARDKKIKKAYSIYTLDPNIIAGLAFIQKNMTLQFSESYNLEDNYYTEVSESILKKNWGFSEKYIRGLSTALQKVKKKKKITEEWIDTITSRTGDVDIYKNPDRNDLIELRKNSDNFIRFIAYHPEKAIYVWDGEKLLHTNMYKHLVSTNIIKRNAGNYFRDQNIIAGSAYIKENGSMYFLESYNLERNESKSTVPLIVKHDWSFTYSKIPGINRIIEKLKKKYDKEQY